MKHPELLYRLMVVLGLILLTTFFVVCYWSFSNIYIIKMPWLEQNGISFFFFFLVGGAVILTIGALQVDIPRIKKYRGFIACSIPLIIILLLFQLWIYEGNQSFVNSFVVRSEITEVTVVSATPLILSLDVKAITDYDSRIDGAIVLNSKDILVAETSPDAREWFVSGNFQGLALAILPAGSEITLNLNFSSVLPSGNYTVRLTGNDINHGSSPFTIP
jgi:hypothetical protein